MSMLEHDWFPRLVPPNIELGERTWLYSSYAFHHNRGTVRIGADCGIYAGTQFELGPGAEVEIGDFCTIVGGIIASHGRVWIGDHTFIAHEVVIADSPFAVPPTGNRVWGPPSAASLGPVPPGVHARRVATPDRTGPPGPTVASSEIEIGAGAWIGARAIVLSGARIGRDAVVGAGAVVTGEVPSGAAAVGNPMRIVSR